MSVGICLSEQAGLCVHFVDSLQRYSVLMHIGSVGLIFKEEKQGVEL
jgi:hypothetical protein